MTETYICIEINVNSGRRSRGRPRTRWEDIIAFVVGCIDCGVTGSGQELMEKACEEQGQHRRSTLLDDDNNKL